MIDDGRAFLMFAAAWAFIGLALGNGLLLPRRVDPRAERLWTAAMLTLGLSALLFSGRNRLPPLLALTGANVLFLGSLWLKALALRAWLGRPLYAGRHLLLALLHGGLYQLLVATQPPDLRAGVAQSMVAAGYGYVAWCAGQVARAEHSRSARLIVGAEALPGVVLLLLILLRMLHGQPLLALPVPWVLMVMVVLFIVGAVVSTVAFQGMVTEASGRAERQARDDAQRALGRGEAAEQHSRQLQLLADQQRQLAEERARLLGLITHEVRQPLHNASGVLQALRRLLQRPQPPAQAELGQRVDRADAVLGRVRDVLDNVLVASLLLEDEHPLALQTVELRLALELALLDLPDDQRSRVRLQLDTRCEQLHAEPNLLRLALRNLLRNACEHGGPAAGVWLLARDAGAADALDIVVRDDGPGFPAAVLAAWARPGDPGPLRLAPDGQGRGLGLQVAARVAWRHGATLRLLNRADGPGAAAGPHGAEAVLHWPACTRLAGDGGIPRGG